jgi:hypothetical protein
MDLVIVASRFGEGLRTSLVFKINGDVELEIELSPLAATITVSKVVQR